MSSLLILLSAQAIEWGPAMVQVVPRDVQRCQCWPAAVAATAAADEDAQLLKCCTTQTCAGQIQLLEAGPECCPKMRNGSILHVVAQVKPLQRWPCVSTELLYGGRTPLKPIKTAISKYLHLSCNCAMTAALIVPLLRLRCVTPGKQPLARSESTASFALDRLWYVATCVPAGSKLSWTHHFCKRGHVPLTRILLWT